MSVALHAAARFRWGRASLRVFRANCPLHAGGFPKILPPPGPLVPRPFKAGPYCRAHIDISPRHYRAQEGRDTRRAQTSLRQTEEHNISIFN